MTNRDGRRAGWLSWLATIAGALLLLAVASWAAPNLEVPPLPAFVVAFTAIAFTVLQAAQQVPPAPPRALLLALPAFAALAWMRTMPPSSPIAPYVITASLLVAGSVVGSVVGARVQAAGHLAVVAVVSSAADVFSVYAPSGPTGAIVDAPATLHVLALPWPMLGTADIPPILGVGDVVFAALYGVAATRLGLSPRRTWIALGCGFAATLVLLLWLQRPIPALPALGASIIIAHPQVRSLPPEDRRRAWVGAALLVVLAAAISAYRG